MTYIYSSENKITSFFMLVWYTLRKLQKCLRKLQKSLRKLQKSIRKIQKCRIEKNHLHIWLRFAPCNHIF